MSRYSVAPLPGTDGRFVIYDHILDGYCSLPDASADDHPNLLPLEWGSRLAAETWLWRCYTAWQRGTVPAPEGWRRIPPPLEPARTITLSESRP
ncbi:hypothetical protein ACWCYZ_42140 [Streptomyces virginiae]